MTALHVASIVHLLRASDAQETLVHPVATITTPDGRTLGLSSAGWTAVEHLVACIQADEAVYLEPVEGLVTLRQAAYYSRLSVEFLQDQITAGELPTHRDAAGVTVHVNDLVPIAAREWARRREAWDEYVRTSDESDEGADGLDP